MHRYNIDEMFGILLNGGEDPVLVKGLFDNELNESQLPTGLLHSHILDQLSNGGSFKFAPKVTSREEENTSVEEKKRLDCTVSITDLSDIDPISESFSVKFRLFLMWKLDLEKENRRQARAQPLHGWPHLNCQRGDQREELWKKKQH